MVEGAVVAPVFEVAGGFADGEVGMCWTDEAFVTAAGLAWVVADFATAGAIPVFWLPAVAGTTAPLDCGATALPVWVDRALGLPAVALAGVQGVALAVLVVAGAVFFLLPNNDLRLDSAA